MINKNHDYIKEYESYDILLNHSIELKKRILVIQDKHEETNGEQYNMFDQFFIFGGNPNEGKPTKPEILAMFPSVGCDKTEDEIRKIMQFCFPRGFKEEKRNPKIRSPIQSEFIFYLTNEDSQRTYGICVYLILSENNNAFFATKQNRPYPFCLCFLTKVPFLSSHFKFATYLALLLLGKVRSTHISNVPLPLPFKVQGFCYSSLMLDKHNPGIAIIHGITPPKILCEELIFFYTKPTHQPNSDVRMVDNLSKRMFLCIPTHLSTKRQLLYPTLHVLFSCLSPSAIVHLYSCILLEYNVLFTSHDMHKLTLSVVAITQLIQPFETQAILIPLLPDSLKQILQSPVPYIIGSIQSEKDGPDVIVNLDKGTVESKKGFPMVPHADKLMADIQKIINSSSESILTPKKHLKSVFGTEQKKRNPDFDKFIRSTNSFVFPSEFTKNISMKYIFTQFVIEDIIGLFESFFPPILDDLIKCYFVTDNTDPDLSVTVLNKELLLSTIDEKDKEFYSAFITTQTFETYCNQVMDNCSKEK